jgi:hypothetical protein
MGILAHNTHVTFNGIASALASRSAGSLISNILCGIFQKVVKNYPDLMLAIAFFIPAIGTTEQNSYSYHINIMCISF